MRTSGVGRRVKDIFYSLSVKKIDLSVQKNIVHILGQVTSQQRILLVVSYIALYTL